MRSQYQNHKLPRYKDESDIYPTTLVYGCGCWLVIVFLALAALAFWRLFD